MQHTITIAHGDGIGPEIMAGCLKILAAAKAPLKYDTIEIGEKIYKQGHTSGIREEDWQTLVRNKVFLKAPITTPQGGGYKSLNVTIRKTLGLFANIRPVRALHPYIQTKHPQMDLVIVRENEEDLYAGIEHRQTDEVYQCLKLITQPGCEKIMRFAFEYAKAKGRKKVTCMSKDNIMKLTDGLFHKTFDQMGTEYPGLQKDHWIIDIGTARLADTPEIFDVIVLPNLYGDILSDVAAQIAGSVGIGGSANIGEHCAMFEAIHGSAPDIAGKNMANPSGLLMGAVEMLNYLGLGSYAESIENAWLATIEDGLHTGDIYKEGSSKKRVGTAEFVDAVIERLGKKPTKLKAASYPEKSEPIRVQLAPAKREEKTLDGVDIFLHHRDRDAEKLGGALANAVTGPLQLLMITNRGVKVFPQGNPLTFCTDHWRCRFLGAEGKALKPQDVVELQSLLVQKGFDVIKTENLYRFNGERAYSLGQGQ